ncbi:MAG: UbiD family decarboxylase [Nitrospinota bacterium]
MSSKQASEIHDLRSALDVLEEGGQLHGIDRPVSLDCELAAVAVELENRGMGAALFTHPKGYQCEGNDIAVVAGVLSHPKRAGLVLGCEPSDLATFLMDAMDRPIPPAERRDAPFLENVLRDKADLNRLPIPRHTAKDGGERDGRFISGGVVFARDPETGRANASFQRFQFQTPRRMGININNWRHLLTYYEKAEARNQPLPIAIALGFDPVVCMAAGIRTEIDEMEYAGALRGRPLEVTPAPETGIPVPTGTEIVIEGDILPHRREAEGPLAEFTGHYSGIYQCPVFEVRAISHRGDPIFQTIVPASLEHRYVGNSLPREPVLYRFARHVSRGVRNVHLPPYGSGFLAVISMRADHPGQPKNVALAALTSHVNIKVVLVVDDDVDIYNPQEVLWCLSTRVDAKRDIFTVPYAQGHEMDPSAEPVGITTKVGIDATLQTDGPGGEREALEKVSYTSMDLSKYLGNT